MTHARGRVNETHGVARVVVYGSSGVGKSTFASELARRCGTTRGRVLSHLVLRRERHGRKTTARSGLKRDLPFVRKTLRSYTRRRAHGEALAEKATALGVRVVRVSSPRDARRLTSDWIQT